MGYMINRIRAVIARIGYWTKDHANYQPLISIEVSRGAILHNLHQLQVAIRDWQLAPVLKSNAYGHGLILVSRILEKEKDIPFFCVDSYFEAEVLRRAGTKKPLLILGYTSAENMIGNKFRDIYFSVGSLAQLKELIEKGVIQLIQLKFDTGMHRQGIGWDKIDEAIEMLRNNPSIKVIGAFSHLADSETPDSKLTQEQIERWNGIVEKLQNKFPSIRYYHLSNSGGLASAGNIKANVGRTGLALYGIDPGNLNLELRPALSMKSVISDIRTIVAGETVGYNGIFVASQPSRIATVPAGYFEGVDRRLSNKGAFMINGQTAPIVGRVSMNISSCDVTDVKGAEVGATVSLIKNNAEDPNSAASIAQLCGTIPYEILVHIPQHLRREEVT
jgi:alanine racemase